MQGKTSFFFLFFSLCNNDCHKTAFNNSYSFQYSRGSEILNTFVEHHRHCVPLRTIALHLSAGKRAEYIKIDLDFQL